MKLLIITQVLDKDHPVLGFFHRWVEEFALHCEQVHVICLQKGAYSLPTNVTVHSLGKENAESRFTYIFRFYTYIWKLRHGYDSVFVHMNQEYVLLAGVYWKFFKKPVSMWRNHYSGNWLTDCAASLCEQVFYTSNASYTQRFKWARRMPIGLDARIFSSRGEKRVPYSLLYVGRIAASKRIDSILESLKNALKKNPALTLTVVGAASAPADKIILNNLKSFVKEHQLPVKFVGPVTWEKLPSFYSQHELCINMSPPGMFDKVIGEALLCECDVVTTNNDLEHLLGERVIGQDTLVSSLSSYLGSYRYSSEEVKKIKGGVAAEHGLDRLVREVLGVSQPGKK